MTLADSLRAELLTITKKDFLDKVTRSIRSNGYYSMSVEHKATSDLERGIISTNDISTIKSWAREEGFNIESEKAFYGQTIYYITL